MDPVRVKNAVDTWVDETRPDKIIGNTARLVLNGSAPNRKRGLVFFLRPWPIGSTLLTARLKLYQGPAFAGANQLTVQGVAKWDLNKVKWSNKPAPSGATATLSQTGTAAGAEWDIDVLPVLFPVANGPWYGMQVTIDTAGDKWFHSAQSTERNLRPVLEVTWSEGPDEPDNPRPGGGRAVSLQYPWFAFDYNDVLGDTDLASLQIQIGTTQALVDSGAAEWKSGVVPSSTPALNTNGFAWPAPAFPGINPDQTLWWRALATDEDGQSSVWMDAVSFVRKTKGVLTITSTDFTNPSPNVTWTFTGRTQASYQVAIAKSTDVNNWLWTSGKTTGTETSVTIPFGIIQPGINYKVIVRVWDDIVREATPNDPTYVEASRTSTVVYDATVAVVTGFQAVSDPVKPMMNLTWSAVAGTEEFAIQRSDDGGVTWKYVAESVASAWNTGGTNYAYSDATAPQYVTATWRVLRIMAGKQSAANPEQSGQIRKIAPFLMRKNGNDICCFLNPKRDRQNLDVQELHSVLGGPPVLVTQRLGKKAGKVEGRLTSDPLPGITAKQMYENFQRLHADSGQEMILLIGDESLTVVCWDFQDDLVVDTSGITYLASFQWYEV